MEGIEGIEGLDLRELFKWLLKLFVSFSVAIEGMSGRGEG